MIGQVVRIEPCPILEGMFERRAREMRLEIIDRTVPATRRSISTGMIHHLSRPSLVLIASQTCSTGTSNPRVQTIA